MRHPNIDLARKLRRDASPEERMLWWWLRQRPLGFKFRRQVPLGPYIVDFASHEASLVIEVDGGFHADQDDVVARQAWVEAGGWQVARYRNADVRCNFTTVQEDIERRLWAMRFPGRSP